MFAVNDILLKEAIAMRYPPAETAQKHQKILEAAARLFRERGFGVSVSEIMKATGLTHGPFYNHFASKEALIAECFAHAAEQKLAEQADASRTVEGRSGWVDAYLSAQHRDQPGDGCLLAALAGDAAREPAVKPELTAYLKETLKRGEAVAARDEVLRRAAMMVGAVMLARAVDDAELSAELLAAARKGVPQ
jgi:TetR/AcrR family transcriptional repressor of nem operon